MSSSYYVGGVDDGIEQMIMLYRAAYAYASHGLLGVVNPLTWMSVIVPILEEDDAADFIDAVRRSPSACLMVWLGFIKFFSPRWVCGLPHGGCR